MTITVRVLLEPADITVGVPVVIGPPGPSGTAAIEAHIADPDAHPQYEHVLTAGANITIDRTDPESPVISATGGGGGGSAAWGDITGTLSDQTDLQGALDGKASTSDSRLSDAREWTAETVSQAEAEAGTATTRRAWTAQRVFQAVAAWWAASAMKTKLDGIATGATANSSDATLLARANHTGTQAASTIDGLDAALSGKQDTLVSGTNVKTINGASLLGSGNIAISGGSGSPGGTTGQVQYNSAGAFAGAANVNISAAGNLLLDATATPAATAADTLEFFARKRAGRMMPAVIGPSGIDTSLQPSLARNAVAMWQPNTGTSASISFGVAWTARTSGTGAGISHPSPTNTSAITSVRRTLFSTGTTETGSCGTTANTPTSWRGDAVGLGGFEWSARICVETFASDVRILCGFCNLTNALTVDPSSLNQIACLAKDSADTNWQIMHSPTGGTTKVDTGMPVIAGQILDLSIFAPPFADWIGFSLADALTGDLLFSHVATTNLPTETFFMRPGCLIQSQTGTTAKQLAMSKGYLESDL